MLEADTLVDQGQAGASFDVIREEYKDDTPSIDRDFERELERSRREGERRTADVQYNAYLGRGLKWYTNPFSRGEAYDSATDAINAQRMADIVNDDAITIDNEMVEVINDSKIKVVDGTIMPSGRDVIRRSRQFSRQNLLPNFELKNRKRAVKRRKPSKYQKELGKQLKMLKKKHPRTPIIRLMKRAHRATRKKINN